MIREPTPRRTLIAGACFICATFTRMDHALFYAVGFWVVLREHLPTLWRARRGPIATWWSRGASQMVAYAVPFAWYLAYLAWKLHYYGDIFPNTYYAKSADLPYWSQGLAYTLAFLLGTHFLWVLPIVVVGACLPVRLAPTARFQRFAAPSLLLYTLYVTRVGGDFMFARFFVSLVPLVLLSTELVVTTALRARHRCVVVCGFILASAVGGTVRGVDLFDRGAIGHIGDENRTYKIVSWFPIVVRHDSYRVGHELAKLRAAKRQPLVATSGPGMVGFYSQLPIVDTLGLIDPIVAHQTLPRRSRPGHEKRATKAYLHQRNPHFIRLTTRGTGPTIAQIRWGKHAGRRRWYIHHYDRELMDRVRILLPDAEFVNFEQYLDGYVRRAGALSLARLRRDLEFFRTYYFDHNDDPLRLQTLERLVVERSSISRSRPARTASGTPPGM